MMRIMFLIILISANCMKMNCDEEPNSNERTTEVSEDIKLLSAKAESLKSTTESTETEKETLNEEYSDEIRSSRSFSNELSKNETKFEDASIVNSTEISITEKSTPDKLMTNETDKQSNKEEVKESSISKDNINSAEDFRNETKSAEEVQNQPEELPETSRSATQIEDSRTEDLSEASAESKLSDNEMTPAEVNKTDRNSEADEIKEKSDESDLDENLATRRMFSGSNFIGTENNNKLTDPSRSQSSPTPMKITAPIVTKSASQELINQQYVPKFYPQPELDIRFPNINSDFQGPRDLPIYLKVKQDELQQKHPLINVEEHNSPFKPLVEKTNFNPNNEQVYQSQRMMDTQPSINKHFDNLQVQRRNQAPRYYHNNLPNSFESFVNNKQNTNVYQNPTNQIQQFHQNPEFINPSYRQFKSMNREPRNQVQELVNSKMPLDNDEKDKYYQFFRQDHKIQESNNQFRSERLPFPYAYPRPPNPQENILYISSRNSDTRSNHLRILYQKLANASKRPVKLLTPLYTNNNNIQRYPYFIYPHIRPNLLLRPQIHMG